MSKIMNVIIDICNKHKGIPPSDEVDGDFERKAFLEAGLTERRIDEVAADLEAENVDEEEDYAADEDAR